MTETPASVAMGPGHEFDLVRAMMRRLGARGVGIGDDAAVLELPRGDELVASVDAVVEDVHFRRGWLSPREVGYRAAVAALSDLAAMAARPLAMLTSVILPPTWEDELLEMIDGIGDAAAAFAAPVVGGNTARGHDFSLTTTVLGTVHGALHRDGARDGDYLYVTGLLGGPRLALDALLAGVVPERGALECFARPVPRLREARWLAAAGASAAIDISDGLAADLGHLAAASGVVLEVALERVPVFPGATRALALVSGEEYELALCAPRQLRGELSAFEDAFGVPITEIGRARAPVPGEEPGVIITEAGRRVASPPGHDHLSP